MVWQNIKVIGIRTEEIQVIITKDGKYYLHNYKSEAELERMIIEHSSEIFGKDALYLNLKKKIASMKGTSGIPDGFLIDFENNKFYIIEIELSVHEIVSHISNQLIRFKVAMNNADTKTQLTKDVYNKILEEKLCQNKKIDLKYLQEVINQKFGIFIIIDDVSEQLAEIVSALSQDGTEVIAIPFETYVDPENNYIHKFRSFTKDALERESKKWTFKWTTIPVEKHLDKTSGYIRTIFSQLSKEICCLPNVKEKSRKGWVTYQTSPLKNFCTIKILPNCLEVHLKSNKEFKDERGITKNIKRTSAWTFDRVFTINSRGDIKYALYLIKQAYACICRK